MNEMIVYGPEEEMERMRWALLLQEKDMIHVSSTLPVSSSNSTATRYYNIIIVVLTHILKKTLLRFIMWVSHRIIEVPDRNADHTSTTGSGRIITWIDSPAYVRDPSPTQPFIRKFSFGT